MTAPRVNDRRTDPDTGERARFSSAILPPWCRKTPKITEVLPLLYLHGLSSGDFVPALGQFLGSTAGPVRAGDHEADRDLEGRAAQLLRAGSVAAWTTSTCGPTASTSTSGWRSTNCACWS